MEKQAKAHSHAACCRLLKWSCILLSHSQFVTVSKNAVSRVAAAQASLLTAVMRRPFREQRACRHLFFHLFSEVLSQSTICLVCNEACLVILWSDILYNLEKRCSDFKFFIHIQSLSIFKTFVEELKNARITQKDSAEFISLLLEYSSENPSLFEEYKVRNLRFHSFSAFLFEVEFFVLI